MIRRSLVLALLAGLSLAVATPARAASKIAIAAAGDTAPGGGVFAGPSLVGEPSAGGNGWVAFRSLVTDGQGPEAIIATNFATRARIQVARVGQTVSEDVGRIKQFLGRPTINAQGDVAFAAEITLPEDAPDPDLTAGPPPTPAGVFLWSRGTLSVIAKPGLETAVGTLDLTTPVNFLTLETGVDISERTPALNDSGDVAFVAATRDGNAQRGAIFRGRAGQYPTPVLALGATWEQRRFAILGPPALNNAGVMAFRGVAEGRGGVDGIFRLDAAGLTLLIRDGTTPEKLPAPFTIDPIAEMGDVVSINDAGDVLCTGGPLFDNADDADFNDIDGSPGVILIKAGAAPLLVGFPGQRVELFEERQGRITELTLGPEEGSRPAVPALGADGTVVFFAIVNNGSGQAIFRVDPVSRGVFPLVRLGGLTADATPVGGTYLSASSSPVLDSAGNITFGAHVQGGTTSEILSWRDASGGTQDALAIGDAAPDPARGYLAGPAFFPPIQNDAGDVIFKAYVTRGQGGLGIFRYRDGQLSPVVRTGDPAPIDGAPALTNLVGDPSLSDTGAVAFSATVAGLGRGIFVADAGGLRRIAMPFDDLEPPDPLREGAFIKTIAAGPSIDEHGAAVVFRGVIQYQHPLGPFVPDIRENCVFLANQSGVHILAAQGQDSGTTLPFWSFRDPVIRGGTVAFRGTVATPFGLDEREGLFLFDGQRAQAIAVAGQDLGGMTFTASQGKPLLDDAGDVFFLARVTFPDQTTGAAVLRSGGGLLQSIVRTGERGPEGGLIRSLSRPSVSSTGNLAIRLGFEPFSGGVAGIFLGRLGSPLTDALFRIGEGGPARINGRGTSVNPKISLNRDDRLAVLASIGGGESRSAILLAGPADLNLGKLAIKRGKPLTPRDRLTVTAVLEPGVLPPAPQGTPDELTPMRQKSISVSVSDSVGPVWSGTLAASDTQLARRTLRGSQGKTGRIAGARVRFSKSGAMRINLRSRPFDLSFSAGASLDRRYDDKGGAILVPPFYVRVDVGEDGASGEIDCKASKRAVRCGR